MKRMIACMAAAALISGNSSVWAQIPQVVNPGEDVQGTVSIDPQDSSLPPATIFLGTDPTFKGMLVEISKKDSATRGEAVSGGGAVIFENVPEGTYTIGVKGATEITVKIYGKGTVLAPGMPALQGNNSITLIKDVYLPPRNGSASRPVSQEELARESERASQVMKQTGLYVDPQDKSLERGKLTVIIKGESGQLLPDVKVQAVKRNHTGTWGEKRSGSDGSVVFENLPAGPYQVACDDVNLQMVDVVAGQETTVMFDTITPRRRFD